MRRIAVALAVCSLMAANDPQEKVVVVKGGTILTLAGEPIKDGIIIIKGGRIDAVGQKLEYPWDATVIDAAGKTIMPGFVEAHSYRGLDRSNENIGSVPFVSTFDAINPVAPYFEDSLRQGITSIFIVPGHSGIIGGQGCVVRPHGLTVEEMIVSKNHGMKMSMAARQGQSKMATLAQLRKELDDVIEYIKGIDEGNAEVPVASEPRKKKELDVKRVAMAELLKGKFPAYIYCGEASDIVRAFEVAQKYGIKATYIVGRDAWRAVDFIKKNNLSVILDASVVYWETDEETREEVQRRVPKAFADAGVKFALQTADGSMLDNQMWYQVATCVKMGVPRDEALKAATLYPAQMIGMGDRLGSIEKGKDANLLFLSGDPLDSMTWVDKVLIEGKVAYEREKDAKLKRLFGDDK